MLNSFAYDRAVDHADVMGSHGHVSAIQVVQLNGYVGRADRPDDFWGYAVTYVHDHMRRFTVWPDDEFDGHKATFVIDGMGFYVAGWQSAGGGLFVNAIDRITNVKTGDVSPHMLSPTRRAYVMWTNGI